MEILTNPAIQHDNKNIRAYWNVEEKTVHVIVTNREDNKRISNIDYEPYIYSSINIDDLDNVKQIFTREIRGMANIIFNLKNDIGLDNAKKLATALMNFYNVEKPAQEVLEDINNEEFTRLFQEVQEFTHEDAPIYNMLVDDPNNGVIDDREPLTVMRDYLQQEHDNDIYNINKEINLPYDLIIDYNKLYEYNSKEATLLVNEPTRYLEKMENALLQLISNEQISIKEHVNIKFDNLEITPANQLLANKVGTMVQTEGIVKGMLEPQFYYEMAMFECNGCHRLQEVEQNNIGVIVEPSICPECGGRSFKLIKEKSRAKDLRYIKLQEPTEDLDTDQRPRNILVCLPGNTSYNIVVGGRIRVTGILDGNMSEDNGQSNYRLNANHVVKMEDTKIEITDEDKETILELAKKDNILDILINSFAPDLIMDNKIKLMILCFIVKGGHTEDLRNEIHLLFIGDPGIAKTRLKNATFLLCEKGIKASGTNASGVGLTGAVSKDPVLGTPIVEAGAIPMAHKGHLFVDEFEKMPKEESQKVLNFMESGEDTITKWGLNETLKGETSIFAIGNPVYGKFDEYKTINEQIKIYPPLQSRFDIVLAIEDKSNEDKDRKIAQSILNNFKQNKTVEDDNKERIGQNLLRKYLAYARNNYNPAPMEDETMDKYLTEYYVESRQCGKDARSFEAINRIGGAIAKLQLHNHIQIKDYKTAIGLQNYSIESLGMDPTNVDIHDIRGNSSNKEREHRNNIKKVMHNYIHDAANEDDAIPKKVLFEMMQDEPYNMGKQTCYNAFNKLKEGKEIYEYNKHVYFNAR